MKRSLIFILSALLTILALTSCTGGGGDNTPPTPPAVDEGAVYGEGIVTRIVLPVGYDVYVTEIRNKLKFLTGALPEVVDESTKASRHEIVFGDTDRQVTRLAKFELEQAISKHTPTDEKIFDTVYYCIYADAGSVAVVWKGEGAEDMAIKHFFENYLKESSLKLEDGHVDFVAHSEIEEMRRAEAAEREETYKRIAAEYGESVADALRDHIAVYDSDFYIWLANLYDPGRYDEEGNPLGGGFYYSNSARDNYGYLIDLESTGQALSFLSATGMVKNFKTDIPEKMQKEMVAFALSCQSEEDGYFYHPQWGKNIIAARRSRDLGWAVNNILNRFGYQPYWDTPNGHKGIYGAPIVDRTAALTEPLGDRSAAVAVSEVVSAASYVDKYQPYMRSLGEWQSYLDSLVPELKTKSYSIGHNLAEQTSQIKMRDEEAAKHGEPTGYVEAVTKFFNDNQNPENGLWEEEVSYNSINGLMKIMALYNGLGIELKYAESAVASAAEIIKETGKDVNGKEATGSVDVYNPWSAIQRVLSNVNTFGDASRVSAMRAELCKNAEEMIRTTTEKTKRFRKDDGSFGYTWSYSPANSQNAPVAVPNTVEGDVNGGTIALTGITGPMLSALGISGLTIYAPSDLKIFLHEIEKMTHVEKEAPVIENEPLTFEEETVGSTSPEVVDISLTDGSVEIVEDGRGGKAIRLNTVPDKGDSIFVSNAASAHNLSCNIIEFDIKFDSIRASSSTAMQISLGNLYMLTVGVTTDGRLTFGDSSATNASAVTSTFGGSFNALEWHKVKVVHYRDAQGSPVITELYVDGSLVGTSDNYLGKESGSSKTGYTQARLYALFSTDFSVLFDNILVDATGDTYGK